MWNETRHDLLKEDMYRAKSVIEVFEQVGFVIATQTNKVAFMIFSDEDASVDSFMIPCKDVAVLRQDIDVILKSINLPVPFFDKLYARIWHKKGEGTVVTGPSF